VQQTLSKDTHTHARKITQVSQY